MNSNYKLLKLNAKCELKDELMRIKLWEAFSKVLHKAKKDNSINVGFNVPCEYKKYFDERTANYYAAVYGYIYDDNSHPFTRTFTDNSTEYFFRKRKVLEEIEIPDSIITDFSFAKLQAKEKCRKQIKKINYLDDTAKYFKRNYMHKVNRFSIVFIDSVTMEEIEELANSYGYKVIGRDAFTTALLERVEYCDLKKE